MGLSLLILGLILWAIGAAVPVPVLDRVGIVLAVIGAVLLVLGLMHVIPGGVY